MDGVYHRRSEQLSFLGRTGDEMTKRDIATVRIIPVKFGSTLAYKWSVEKFNVSKRFDS